MCCCTGLCTPGISIYIYICLEQLLCGTRTAWAVRRSTGVHADSCGSPNNSLCTHLTGSRKSLPSAACHEYLTSCVGNHYQVDWKQLETVLRRPLENQNAANLMLDWCQQSTYKRLQHKQEKAHQRSVCPGWLKLCVGKVRVQTKLLRLMRAVQISLGPLVGAADISTSQSAFVKLRASLILDFTISVVVAQKDEHVQEDKQGGQRWNFQTCSPNHWPIPHPDQE